MTNSDACVDISGIPDSLRLDIRCPIPTTETTELTVTCGETRLYVARAQSNTGLTDRNWAVFTGDFGNPSRRRNLIAPATLTYDEAVDRATIMVGERERGRLWREALTNAIGEDPDD